MIFQKPLRILEEMQKIVDQILTKRNFRNESLRNSLLWEAIRFSREESAGDFPKATSILEEMQKIVDNNQAELPKRPFGIAYYGKSVSPEVERQLNDDAVKELYTFMGVTHLYEFYEK